MKTVADEIGGERVDLFDVLLREDRGPGRDSPQEGHRASIRPLAGKIGVVVVEELDRPRLRRIDLEVALPHERLDVGVRGRRGVEAERVADLAHRRRVAAALDGLRDEVQRLALPIRQPFNHVCLRGRRCSNVRS
jgi:hypothetical protein